MNESRRAAKVGFFVFLGLGLIAALLIQFSKSSALFTPTYVIRMQLAGAPGLAIGAQVQMAGKQIGNVQEIELGDRGRTVFVLLKIRRSYAPLIQEGTMFKLDQAGFLGDQYVTLVPGETEGRVITPGETVQGEPSVSFQEIARSAGGLIQKVDHSVSKLNEAITRIDATILSGPTLTNLNETVANFRNLSERSLAALDTVDRIFRTNAPSIGKSVSNLMEFSHELKEVSGEFRQLMLTNRTQFTTSMSNVQSATTRLDSILGDVEQGKGLLGGLLRNDDIVPNISMLSSNLAVTSSNLNRKGLWGIMWTQPTPPKKK